MQSLSDRGLSDAQSHLVMERMLSSQSSLMGMIDYFWLAGWILLATVVIVWLAKPPFTAAQRAPQAE